MDKEGRKRTVEVSELEMTHEYCHYPLPPSSSLLSFFHFSLFLFIRLHSIHGNRWATIGKALGVSGRAAQDKYKSMTKRQKKGI